MRVSMMSSIMIPCTSFQLENFQMLKNKRMCINLRNKYSFQQPLWPFCKVNLLTLKEILSNNYLLTARNEIFLIHFLHCRKYLYLQSGLSKGILFLSRWISGNQHFSNFSLWRNDILKIQKWFPRSPKGLLGNHF